jgi:cytochrome c heme-lyase
VSDIQLLMEPRDESSKGLPAQECPIDHSSDAWKNMTPPPGHPPVTPYSPAKLSQGREISSIPRTDGSNWVYPSQAQFYSAMARKNHNPQPSDMRVLVPIHNAVNERAWSELMWWEKGQSGEKCGGVKLVSFKGRPQDRTIRAWFNIMLG